MRSVVVLGAGMVGSVIADDLARQGGYRVTVIDRDEARLDSLRRRIGSKVIVQRADLASPAGVREVVAPHDLVIGALSSTLGYRVLEAVIEAGRNCCDISFMPERALDLDERARRAGVTAVVDCGVAPGLSHMMAGAGVAALDQARSVEIYVGGLPVVRQWPFEYKAAFAPRDVIEEYTRPSRLVVRGRVVEKPALSECELIDIPGVGTLEAFNTDGLRTLVETLVVPDMKEKTLRYPGHVELMRVFREAGFLSSEPVEVEGVRVRPVDLFSALVFPSWSYAPGEEDLTVMRVVVRGTRDGRRVTLSWDLLDRYDPRREQTSMARTTAFPCAIVARLIDEGRVGQRGVIPPERLGGDSALFRHVLAELGERGVGCRYEERVEESP
ncbi:MAG: saccharopine dehydrogenase family protein [Acidobacteriota bacterium]|nr:saccharopine dehydrogenase family protein [Acidobacteriota bacterium]